jgi:uncharacterized protein (DUF2267 family)
MDPHTFYGMVRERLGQCDREDAKRGAAAVLHALRDRLTPDEADQAAAQLPGSLRAVWSEAEPSERIPLKLNREQFYERVRGDAGLLTAQEAQWLTLAVFAALKGSLSPGEAEDVMAQLPKDLKEVWVEAV